MICQHWQYLRALDSDLHKCSRFVDINPRNFRSYSIEFVRILLAASSEIDVVAKILCNCIDPTRSCEKINEYRETIVNEFPKFPSMIIDVPQYELQLTPWNEWSQHRNPGWWRAYNNVKHKRDDHFADASLENSLNAVAGLFVIVWYLHHKESNRKKLGKTVLLSADRYIDGVQWANTYYYKIPEELAS